MNSITSSSSIHSFRLRQTIETRYRDMPEAGSLSVMLTEARRNPPAVLSVHSVDGGSSSTTLILDSGLWTRAGDTWTLADVGELPDGWALKAYRELGDMSLVAPVAARTVIEAVQTRDSDSLDGVPMTRVTASTELMVRLLANDYRAAGRSAHDPAPPESYIRRYEASFWIDPATGFIMQEQTVVEYTEERLHGQIVGTGPGTFTTTRTFYDLNADVEIPAPDAQTETE